VWGLGVHAQEAGYITIRCFPEGWIESRLESKHNEVVIGGGLNKKGNLMKLWVSEGGKSWTMTVTRPSGESCLVDLGDNWRDFEMEAGTGL